jgi:hypothetical protein
MKTFQLNKPTIIMAFNSGLPRKEEESLIRSLSGLPFKSLVGCWSGHVEYSYAFVPRSHTDMHHLIKLAREYKQKAIMYLDEYRNMVVIPADHYETAYLMLRGGLGVHTVAREMDTGVLNWRPVDKETALRTLAYTMDPKTDSYWVAA